MTTGNHRAASAPTKTRVLLVEEDATTRHIARLILGAEHYEVVEAPDGATAAAFAREAIAAGRPFDVIIFDPGLPDTRLPDSRDDEVKQRDLLLELMGICGIGRVRVLITTGSDIQVWMRSGVFTVIQKPYLSDRLRGVVDHLIANAARIDNVVEVAVAPPISLRPAWVTLFGLLLVVVGIVGIGLHEAGVWKVPVLSCLLAIGSGLIFVLVGPAAGDAFARGFSGLIGIFSKK